MDEYIKQSIKARKDAIYNTYKVSPEKEQKIDALFKDIEKLGAKCKDSSEFEAEFSKSPLNQKYIDLFTEVATDKNNLGGEIAKGATAGAMESIADQAINQVVPTKAAVHQKAYDAARDIPVVGDAIDISQKAGYVAHLSKLFKKPKK